MATRKHETPSRSEGAEQTDDGQAAWRLEDQVGFLLRRAQQRHLAIFAEGLQDLTPTQFAALVTLAQAGPLSQNDLGRRTAMDAATIKGVVDRLRARGLVCSAKSDADRRRLTVEITEAGRAGVGEWISAATRISNETLAPLSAKERIAVVALLRKLG